VQQAGGGLPVFAGARVQQGHGLGNLLGGLFRMAIPLLKSGVGVLKREAVKAGVGLAGNMLKKATSATLRKIAPAGHKGIKRKRTETNAIDSRAGAGKSKRSKKNQHKDIFQ
jgi:hypothetical protein